MEKDKKLTVAEKSDDLEISSIGSIYRGGHWEKKYWSSSRGKDRYPYPVGYQAIRTHAGNTYTMEIRDGLKGPVFVVISPDGDSYFGQTPDIAWDNFQKKSCSKVKNWLGKRFSSKIDGVELFGFRNPFVQRLLRELVAKVNGVDERSTSLAFGNKPSKFDNERIDQSRTDPELLPFLRKEQITGKRSMKNRSSAENLTTEAKIKRTRSQLILNNRDCTNAKESTQDGGIQSVSKYKNTMHFQEEHPSTFKDGNAIRATSSDFQNLQGDSTCILDNEQLDLEYSNGIKTIGRASSRNSRGMTVDPSPVVQVKVANIVEEKCHSLLSRDALLMEAKHSVCSAEKTTLFHEQTSDIADNQIVSCVSKMPLGVELEQKESSEKSNNGEHADFARRPNACTRDTCDTEIDGEVGSTLEGQKASLCSMNNELVLARSVTSPARHLPQELACMSTPYMSIPMHPLPNTEHAGTAIDTLPKGEVKDTLPKGIIKDSLPEVGSSSGSSNQLSDKIDLDIAGQELARSMMTFLLPRAVPLLTKTYVKSRTRHLNRENKTNPCSTSLVPISGEQVKNKYLTDMMCQGNNVAKALVHGPEVTIQDRMNSPQELPGTDSLCPVTRVEPFLAGCMTTEPFVESGSSKDIKCVIQDSFEDDHSTHDISVQGQDPPRFDEVENALFDGIKGNVDSPILPKNNSERPCFCSGNDGSNGEILLLDGNKKDENSLQVHVPGKCIPLKEAFFEECTHELVKVADWESNCSGCKSSANICMDLRVIHKSSLLHNLGCAENTKAESNRFLPTHDLSNCDQAGHSYQGPSFSNKLGDEVSGPYNVYSSEKDHNNDLNGQVNFDVHVASDYKDANVKNKVGGPHITLVEQDIRRGDSIVKSKSALLCKSKVLPSAEILVDSHEIGNVTLISHSSEKYIVPLSEIIICRKNINSSSPELQFPQIIPDADEKDQAKYVGNGAKISLTNELEADEKLQPASRKQNRISNVTEGIEPSHLNNPLVLGSMNCVNAIGDLCLPEESCMQSEEHMNALGSFPLPDLDPTVHLTTILDSKGPHTPLLQKSYLDDSPSKKEASTSETRDSMELVGFYLHPNPVLSVSLTSNDDGLQISVLCGLIDSDIRNIFMYMIPAEGCRGDSPFFLGYTSLMLCLQKNSCCRNISFERSELQFIRGFQSLVFLNSVKAPRCMEQSFDCSCTTCTSSCCEENTVEIVHLNFGFVSSVIKLVAMERISCILACEPNYLIAVEQSGNLHVWVMNLEWSVNLEEFRLPKFDEQSPEILELKTIPNCKFLIIGHNGLGGFALWDISRRALLAKFSSPGITTFSILPISLFKWQSEDYPTTSMEMNCIMQGTFITDNLHPKAGGDSLLASFERDIAVWLLVSADSDADAQHQVKEPKIIPFGCWRLGLLVRNMVVLGSILDPRASAASTSSHYGIYGTCDGFLYKWELTSGEKVAGLHPFKCGSVSHIAVDTKSGAFAVADNGCQLLVYAQPRLQQ